MQSVADVEPIDPALPICETVAGGAAMPFSDEELALIEAIHADPKNDTPRLAYAD